MPNRIFIREVKAADIDKAAKSPTAAYILYYHITFRTKWSRPTFAAADAAERMAGILMAICEDKGFQLFGAAVMADYIHIVVSLAPNVAPATAVRYLKGSSARLFHKDSDEKGSLWSDGYSVEAVGTKNVRQALSYVANQEAHHGLLPG